MAVGDIVTASRFNLLQGQLATILGTGTGDSGYGQVLQSRQVAVGELFDADLMDALRADLAQARIHQTGVIPSEIGDINQEEIIGEDESGGDTTKGFADYEALLTDVVADKLVYAGTQVDVFAGIQAQRTTQWNGLLEHEFTVTFGSANDKRHFFNTGGEIRLSATLADYSNAKSTDWYDMFIAMGTVKFSAHGTTATGLGGGWTGSAIGNYELTSANQVIFTKYGSGIYAENYYQVEAKNSAVNQITFLVTFNDLDPTAADIDNPSYPPTDEFVNGTLTSVIQQQRTINAITLPSPSFANNPSKILG